MQSAAENNNKEIPNRPFYPTNLLLILLFLPTMQNTFRKKNSILIIRAACSDIIAHGSTCSPANLKSNILKQQKDGKSSFYQEVDNVHFSTFLKERS